MARILIVEDDPTTRRLICLHLESAGYEAIEARDGAEALRDIAKAAPDLILSDLEMPNLDGFGLLQAVRASGPFASVPVVFLTSRQDRDAFRKGMVLGADDFLHKPVQRDRLLEAIATRLKRQATLRQAQGFDPAATNPHAARRMRSAAAEPAPVFNPDATSRIPRGAVPGISPDVTMPSCVQGTVLFLDIRNFTTFAERLADAEVVEMLNVFLARVCEPVRQQCGWVVKFLGDGLAAMFESRSAARDNHAERGIKAALLMMLVARDFRAWMSQRFPTHVLPEFAIGIGLHCGPSMVCEMGGGDGAETTVIGDTVNTASRLQDATKELMWSIAASRACVDAAGTRILCGRSRDVVLKGKAMPVQAVEVAGLLARDGGSPVERGFYAELRSAVTANSAVVASQRIAALGKRAYAQLDRPLAHEVAHS